VEDQFIDMLPLNHGFLLAVPTGLEGVHHRLAESLSCPAPTRPKVRARAVACGFPERRLRVTVRMDRVRETG